MQKIAEKDSAPSHPNQKTEAQKEHTKRTTPGVTAAEKPELGPHATMGRIVFYREHGHTYVALVVASDLVKATLDLTVFGPAQQFDRRAVTQSVDAQSKTWFWPPKN